MSGDERREIAAPGQVFRLDEMRWRQFIKILDRPISMKPRLRRLMNPDKHE